MSRTYSYSSYRSVSPFRFPYRKSYGFIIMILMVLIMSWESQQMDAALAKGGIPEEAIRLRILAHSDSPSDQLVKRVVRDEVVKAMNSWATGQQTIEEARATIQSKLPELQQLVASVLQNRGFVYDSSAELGLVEFPTKMYGNKVYPAGQYEALLITIGEGQGQNWWCVLFPPLCFVDAVSGEASAASGPVQESAAVTVSADSDTADNDVTAAAENHGTDAPKAKFFLWELLQSLIDWIKSLF
ncbi:stage II sporulation protein R [Paenibacillus sp. NPDC057967]|uniref:stage II sporulation protein R n=1 Tax=Paenibacillus sp. NPDC057967 TaxID=3346293 RepID=UPI0036DDECCF